MTVKRGEVYTADLSGSIGHEQTGTRPVIVIQNDKANQKSGTVVVACITSKKQARRFPTHISIRLRKGKLSLFSRVMLEQIRTIDKSRILKWIGQADDSTMRALNHVLSYSLDLAVQENPERHDQI